MATQKIEYQNKVAIDDVGVPEKNKITADNMNEIKEVVNNNADNADETTAAINSRIDTANNAINNIVENTYTKTETNEKLAQKADISDIPTDLSQLSNATTKFVNETQLQEETTARENTDNNLQGQIDAIVASSDVVDIVGTYQELQNYDTSHLGDNDIIKVLLDSTHNNATSYYRWKKHTSTWQYIGSEGPYYTKSESNEKFVEKETGKGLSSNDFTNAYRTKLDDIESGAEVNIIEKVKVNNTDLPIENKEVNIDLTDYVKNTDYATAQKGGVVKGNLNSFNVTSDGIPYGTTYTYSQYQTIDNANFISKGTLETVITGKQLINQTQLDTKQDKITSENAGNKIEIENSLLSSEYQQVEYIESSGGQYIDTGVKGNNNTRTDISFRTKTVGNSQAVFGYYVGGYNKTLFLYSSGDKHFQVGYGAFQNLSDSWVDNTKYEISLSNGKIIINGTEMTITEASDFTTDKNLLLFKISGSTGGGMPIQLYNFKIYNGDTLVRNFIPCYKISNNEIGLYDIVNNVFYTNAGTGTFTKGENINSNLKISVSQDFIDNYNKLKADHPDIEEEGTDLSLQGTGDFELALSPKGNITQAILPEAYQQVEYIESSGTQYINTGYVPSQNTKIDISFMFTQLPLRTIYVCGASISYDSGFNLNVPVEGVNVLRNAFGNTNRITSITAQDNKMYNVVTDKAGYKINGTQVQEEGGSTGFYNGSLFLFADNRNGSPLSNYFLVGRIYTCKLYENGVLVRNLIPCYRKSDSVIGMYDIVNNTFYINAGTGTFTKGSDAPTPNAEIPVKVVDGEYEVEVENKNLLVLDFDTASEYVTINSDDSFSVNNTTGTTKYPIIKNISLKAGTYTMLFAKDSDIENIFIQRNNDGAYNFFLNSDRKYREFTFTETGVVKFQMSISANTQTGTVKLMLLKGSYTFDNQPSYQPHKSQTQTIDTSPNPLYSANDYYYKSNGNWYVHNEWGKVVYTGASSESWSLQSVNSYGIANFFIAHNLNSISGPAYSLCNYFINQTGDISTTTEEGYLWQNNGAYFRIKSTTASDVTNFKTWLNTNNITLVYKLNNPTNTPITNTTLINQLETFQNMLAYQDQTNISQTHNEAQADMKINAKTIMSLRYMQSEIEELKQAILNS